MVALIVVASITVVRSLGQNVNASFQEVDDRLAQSCFPVGTCN